MGHRLQNRAFRSGALALMLAFALIPAAWAEKVSDLKPSNYVNDFAGVMDAGTVNKLNLLGLEVESKTKAQIAVVTIKSLDGETIEQFAVELFKAWGVGGKQDNRGVLILLAVSDRKYRVEVGYGLEPILPDGKVGGFGREMVPDLRAGNYGGAVSLVTNRVAQTIAQDAGVELLGVTAPPPRKRRDSGIPGWLVLLIFIFFPVLGSILRALGLMRPRRRGYWGGGGFGGFSGGGFGGGGGGGGGGGFGGFGGGFSGGGGSSGGW